MPTSAVLCGGRQLQPSCGVGWVRGALGDPAGSWAGKAVSCILGSRPPSYLWGQLAGLGRTEVTCLEVARASTCIALPFSRCPSFGPGDWDPVMVSLPTFPHLLCWLSPSPPPPISLSLPGSLGLYLSGPGSLGPGAGLCKCGISLSSVGLPAWLTFNFIHGSASAEPLIKAGRQFSECQGGLGPTG